ncbi:MAG: N-acetylneuraminate synthase family protein, partial [Oscillospiraceae bacterium]
FELVDIPLIEYAASKGKPMIISCGMGSIEEIQDAVDACRSKDNDRIVLLKCCSEYPANYDDMNLLTIQDMQSRFSVPIGLSDHSSGSIGAVVGVSLGACVVEKHVCLSRALKNPDSEVSMEMGEFAAMVRDIRNAERIKGKVSYALTESEKASTVFRRSLFAVNDIKKGELLTENNIRAIRPSEGAKPKTLKLFLGKTAFVDVERGQPITAQIIEASDK